MTYTFLCFSFSWLSSRMWKELTYSGSRGKTKYNLTFQALLCDLNGTTQSSDVLAFSSCPIRGFLTTTIHLLQIFPVSSSTLCTNNHPAAEGTTAGLKVRSEAMTTSLTSFRSYPSFQRHRRCFLISSRIPSIHSQKGKFLSFIFSWNSEYGKAGMKVGRTGIMRHEFC